MSEVFNFKTKEEYEREMVRLIEQKKDLRRLFGHKVPMKVNGRTGEKEIQQIDERYDLLMEEYLKFCSVGDDAEE